MPPGCSVVEERRPPFFVVNSILNRKFNNGAENSPNGYYPKGTVVRVHREDLGRIYLSQITTPTAIFPRVTVLSVPKDNAGNPESQADGKRATVGTEGYIRASDLGPMSSLSAPESDIFQVNNDSPAIIAREFRGRAIRLAFDGENYLTKRCGCANDKAANDNLLRGKNYQFEYDRHPSCTYSPIFELLQAIDREANQAPAFTIERFLTPDSCDTFAANLTHVERNNYGIFLRIRDALVNVGSAAYSLGAGFLDDLRSSAHTSANEPRTVCNGARCHSVQGFYKPKSLCRRGVRETLQRLNLWPKNSSGPSNDAAYALARNDNKPIPAKKGESWLEKNLGFRNVMGPGVNSSTAPVGSVLVYAGGGFGHVEIKVDSQQYCSDFCTGHPIDRSSTSRTLIGIYLPKGNR